MIPAFDTMPKNDDEPLTHEVVERYLRSVLRKDVRVLALRHMGEPEEGKGFGYGVPVLVEYEIDKLAGATRERAVLHTMSPGSFGHEHMPDRARILLWSHRTFNRLPRHVRSLDVGGFEGDGGLLSLSDIGEFFLLTEYAEGRPYAVDLERIRDTGELTDLDLARADALCDYLIEIHGERGSDPGLWLRRNRELVGDGECIMGLADSYPRHSVVTPEILEHIEHHAVTWRWRLRDRSHRLRRVHGDFHPWNILFASGADFRVLDRSRGECGDPADDVTCITLNYVFFPLQRSGKLEGAFENLFLRFWNRYLDRTGDWEILQVAAPFFVFRALVLASPVWYPALPDVLREKLLKFILAVLVEASFDPRQVNRYCGV
ncbi:MAG TPA: phosphotransferase [Bryobacteraceae bacterium]